MVVGWGETREEGRGPREEECAQVGIQRSGELLGLGAVGSVVVQQVEDQEERAAVSAFEGDCLGLLGAELDPVLVPSLHEESALVHFLDDSTADEFCWSFRFLGSQRMEEQFIILGLLLLDETPNNTLQSQ